MTTRPAARDRARRIAPRALAALFVTSGIIHLVRPSVFTPLIPRALPAPTGLVLVSGVAELVCAGGLVRRSSWAGPASAAVLLAVFPGNVQMALDVSAAGGSGTGHLAQLAAVWGRLPLQLPLLWAALAARPDPRVRPGPRVRSDLRVRSGRPGQPAHRS